MRDRGKSGCWLAILLAVWLPLGSAAAAPAEAATYFVRVLSVEPLRIGVTAMLPPTARLSMSTTRPGGIDALDRRGWPAMVERFRVQDADGRALEVREEGDGGWTLATPSQAAVALSYEVDASVLADAGWPAPRESIHADPAHLVLVGRALFVTADGQAASRVVVEPPPGWHVTAPWPRDPRGGYRVADVGVLQDNLLAVSREPALRARAGNLEVGVVAIGWSASAHAALRSVVSAAAQHYARTMPLAGPSHYLAVVLPQRERGGESFHDSFAMNVAREPTPAGVPDWGDMVAHEIFHYWNGWRLVGRDYASTQWFQEGFTEYAAHRALLKAGLLEPGDFLGLLSKHLRDSRALGTPLDAPGSRKGPPLYGAGALIAFCWDASLDAHGHRLDDLFNNLWRRTGSGAQGYDWATIRASLQALDGSTDWQSFHDRFIAGREPPPLHDAMRALGLRLDPAAPADAPRLEPDPDAGPEARARWRAFAEG